MFGLIEFYCHIIIIIVSRITYEWNSPNAQDYEPSETSVPSTSTNPKNYKPYLISAIMRAITIDNTENRNINSSAKRGSIIFKGVLQLHESS